MMLRDLIEEPEAPEAPENTERTGYPWTTCNIAAVREAGVFPIRVATDGKRIRIRCTDLRFDPPIEMDVIDFAGAMQAAIAVGVTPHGDVVLERRELFHTKNTKMEQLICKCRAEDLIELRAAANALLHQIDIGDFTDSNGHTAQMLKATHDLMRVIGA